MVEYGGLASRGNSGGVGSELFSSLRSAVSTVVDYAHDNPWHFGGGVVLFIVVMMFVFKSRRPR